MTRRKTPRDRRRPPPAVYPKLLCIGGPRDGELLSQLDLPLGAVITASHVRRNHYVRVTRPDSDVWLWQEATS